ncbi:MAG: hypothetical protein CO189_07575 [candidate division Zixibacteria bacterium CG_4_9_14_3_um_filter_46_8]|nr:MAG: hypothetical protein CO189_07575 [candidate division Zixibacteria bacterium CG_4_9_14_3_um_filter_46_8]
MTIISAISFSSNRANAAQVYGTLSNFDIHNFTQGLVNDFHLILQGPGLTCSDIFNYYNGWGTFGGMPTGGCTDLGGGKIRITWGEPDNPLPHCTYAHFGLHLEQGNENVRAIAAYWTFNGQIVGGISFIS